MTRLFLEAPVGGDGRVELRDEAAHYLGRVLRLRPGDVFVVVEPEGRAWQVVVREVTAQRLVAQVEGEATLAAESPLKLDLYCALLKGQSFELVVQKATELGVGCVVPLVTDRAISRPDGAKAREKAQRWRKIAQEACRQCGRGQAPEVAEPLSWREGLERWRGSEVPGVMACEVLAGSPGHALRRVWEELGQPVALAAFVGPEGGFAPREMEQGAEAGLRPVSLGPRVLRAETAALAVCAVVAALVEG